MSRDMADGCLETSRTLCLESGLVDPVRIDDDVTESVSYTHLDVYKRQYVPLGSDLLVAYAEAGEGLTELMHALSAERLEHPTDDLTSALINTNIDGEALTHAELASFFIELVVAGNETIRNAIAHGLWALTQNPDQRAIWRADLDGVSALSLIHI